MSETVCPLCQTPRPRGAKRCICNYTFEYDAPMRIGSPARRSGMSPMLPGLAIAGAVVAGGLAHGVEPKPEGVTAPVVMIIAGLFAAAGAFGGWSWFFAGRRARRVHALLGAAGARGFYALLGGALVGGGASFLLG